MSAQASSSRSASGGGAQHARVGDRDVDPPELLDRALRQGVDLGAVADVDLLHHAPATRRPRPRRRSRAGSCGSFGVAADDDRGALPGIGDRGGAADALAAPVMTATRSARAGHACTADLRVVLRVVFVDAAVLRLSGVDLCRPNITNPETKVPSAPT